MKHNFLRTLDYPKNPVHRLPSETLDSSLTYWNETRGHELKRPTPPRYDYYAGQMVGDVNRAWGGHDRLFELELSDDISDEEYALWSFDAQGEYPARVLCVVASHMGWRLIPYARWVSLRCCDQSLGFYVEQHCRQWAEEADTVFRMLQGKPVNRNNGRSQIALINPVRNRGNAILDRTVTELRRYHD